MPKASGCDGSTAIRTSDPGHENGAPPTFSRGSGKNSRGRSAAVSKRDQRAALAHELLQLDDALRTDAARIFGPLHQRLGLAPSRRDDSSPLRQPFKIDVADCDARIRLSNRARNSPLPKSSLCSSV